MLRRIVLCSTPIVATATKPQSPPEDESKKRLICRPSELPLYPPPVSTVSKVEIEELSTLQKAIMEPIAVVTSTLQTALLHSKEATHQLTDTVDQSTKQFKFIVTYLREEDNEAQRVGAVVGGTLGGFIFGLRGGLFKRLLYSLIGAGGMASICYPKEAQEYYKKSLTEGKLLVNVAYNFIHGVKPGDPQPEIKFPEVDIPKSFPEFLSMASNVGSSIKNLVMPPKKDEKSD